MATLTRETRPDASAASEPVEVPEFGEDESGEAYQVIVHALSVHDWNMMFRGVRQSILPGAENGQANRLPVAADYDEICLVAATSARDDAGELVFGKDVTEAVEYVKELPGDYWPAILRIYGAAMRLSDYSWIGDTAINSAEKN